MELKLVWKKFREAIKNFVQAIRTFFYDYYILYKYSNSYVEYLDYLESMLENIRFNEINNLNYREFNELLLKDSTTERTRKYFRDGYPYFQRYGSIIKFNMNLSEEFRYYCEKFKFHKNVMEINKCLGIEKRTYTVKELHDLYIFLIS